MANYLHYLIAILCCIALCDNISLAQSNAIAPSIEWSKCYGGTRGDLPSAVLETSDHQYLLAGSIESKDGDGLGSHGDWDMSILKLDKTGTVLWKRLIGGSAQDFLKQIIETKDGGCLACGHTLSNDGNFGSKSNKSEDYALVKLANDGTIEWTKTYGGSLQDEAKSLIEVSDGYIICGNSTSKNGQVQGHHGFAGTTDVWIIKVDKNGNLVWNTSLGGTDAEGATTILSSIDGNLIVAGSTSSIDGDIPARDIAPDVFVAALSPLGKLLWSKTYSANSFDYAVSLCHDSNSGYFMAGYTYSTEGIFNGKPSTETNLFVLHLDSSGDVLWSKVLGGSKGDLGWHCSADATGNLLVSAVTSSTDGDLHRQDTSSDIWLLYMSGREGAVLWDSTYGGKASEWPYCSIVISEGGFLVAAYTYSNEFDNYHKESDILLLKLHCASYLYLSTATSEKTYTLCDSIPLDVIIIEKQFCGNFALDTIYTDNPLYIVGDYAKDSQINSIPIQFVPSEEGVYLGLVTVRFHSNTSGKTLVDTVLLHHSIISQTPFTLQKALMDTVFELCTEIPHRTIHIRRQSCKDFALASITSDNNEYSVFQSSPDSVQIGFSPSCVGMHTALLTVSFQSKELNRVFIDTIRLTDLVTQKPEQLRVTDIDISQDTIGGMVQLPIVIPHERPLPPFLLYYHFDEASLIGASVSPITFKGEDFVSSDTIGWLQFLVYPNNFPYQEIVLDSVTLPKDCYNIQLPKEFSISTSNRCGDKITSDFMQGRSMKIEVYPNPSRHSVTLNLPYDTGKLRFYDRLGKKVLETSYQNTRQVDVDIHTIPNGIYEIDVESAFGHANVSLIKN